MSDLERVIAIAKNEARPVWDEPRARRAVEGARRKVALRRRFVAVAISIAVLSSTAGAALVAHWPQAARRAMSRSDRSQAKPITARQQASLPSDGVRTVTPPVPTLEADPEDVPKGPRPRHPRRNTVGAEPSAGELMQLADTARLEGRQEDAIAALARVVKAYPTDEFAPVAAFAAGRILLDVHRPKEGAQAFAQASRLLSIGRDRNPELEDVARLREAEAWAAAGDRPRARALAAEQLRQRPHTRHRARLEALVKM